MATTAPGGQDRMKHQALIDRVIALGASPEGRTNVNAVPGRQLARLRVENRRLQLKPGPDGKPDQG